MLRRQRGYVRRIHFDAIARLGLYANEIAHRTALVGERATDKADMGCTGKHDARNARALGPMKGNCFRRRQRADLDFMLHSVLKLREAQDSREGAHAQRV